MDDCLANEESGESGEEDEEQAIKFFVEFPYFKDNRENQCKEYVKAEQAREPNHRLRLQLLIMLFEEIADEERAETKDR